MKRQVVTLVTVVGVLVIAAGAASLNARVLRNLMDDPGRIDARTIQGMTMMGASIGLPPPPSAQPLDASTAVNADAQVSTQPATNIPAPPGTPGGRVDRLHDARGEVDAGGVLTHERRPPLTPDQRNLLRIAAMAHVRPWTVLAAARGQAVDPGLLTNIEAVAQYIGVDLKSLTSVTALPRMMDRGHGGPNDHGGMNFDN
ncbi:MAG: hypothetical protein ACYC3W_06565 [Candidatus Nanopelagicales bacterium]